MVTFLDVLYRLFFLAAFVWLLWCGAKAFQHSRDREKEILTWLMGFWIFRPDMFDDEGNKHRKRFVKLLLGLVTLAALLGVISIISGR